MPFGLKNVGATYQRLVDKAFDGQIGRNIEVYVDELVIKSHTEAEMLRDIDETFRIKSCPDKTKAVLQLPSPRTIKEVQSLNGKLASLNRFLSKLAEKSLPLFKTLKKCIKKSDFHWTSEAKQAFKQLKQHLSELPMLVAPRPKEELIVYLSASYGAISAVLMTEMRKTLFTDGSSCVDGSGAGLILTSPEITEFTYALRFHFAASNNEAEYETLIAGLRIAAQIRVQNVHVSVDSKLIANQVLGAYVAKEENMIKYLEKVKSLVSGFTNFSINQVPRRKNKKAGALSKIASTSFAHLSKQVLVEILKEEFKQENEVTTMVEEDGLTWMTPIIEYLKEGTLPGDRKEARKLRIKARQYELLEGHARGTTVRGGQSYTAGILLANDAPRRTRYDMCMQRLSNNRPVTRNPQQPLTPITALWPFYKWGIDIASPFPEGTGKVKFLIVAIDYFTKWIEAKAMATLTGNQSNGLVERANRSVGEGIKARLGEGNKNWIEELTHVLWAHRTMIKSSHADTPFSLTYETKAVIPSEIGMPTYRTAAVDVVYNDEELRLNLDLLEERRERVAIREAKAKLKMTKYYNARVRGVTFRPGDFVYRSNDASHAMDGRKLGPKWEGSYEITEALGDEAYKLRSADGTVLPRTWNVANLKKVLPLGHNSCMDGSALQLGLVIK
uniref:Reverse transcriptase domain-containing protein n=1 Tax=Tanacetum cinerariifolium TaxID=118510 RepID=A0A699I476_TANCI|nr:reverse transcriptase domain-containing protein [Tanacetum cinerariifolium]